MFVVKRLCYELSSNQAIILHDLVPTITLRGALGFALIDLLANYENIPDVKDKRKIFKAIFAPQKTDIQNATHENLPRPYVLRGYYKDHELKQFFLELILFGAASEFENLFDELVALIADRGLGSQKTQCICKKLFSEIIPLEFPDNVHHLQVDFITPLVRLKHRGKVLYDNVPFYVLFARFIDRYNEIDKVYGSGEGISDDEVFYLKQVAAQIQEEVEELGRFGTQRKSSRTKDTIQLRGFLGRMHYYGDFNPLAQYLAYLPWLHVGRFNTFGCGWVNLHCSSI